MTKFTITEKRSRLQEDSDKKRRNSSSYECIRWDDLYSLIDLANKLVDERDQNPDFGILLDKRQSLESEADYLANKLVSIEKSEEVSVVAEVDGKLIGNSEVTRGKTTDEFHHGKLGIALLREYRDFGIGFEMMKILADESRSFGLKTIELRGLCE